MCILVNSAETADRDEMLYCFRDIISSFANVPTTSIQNEKFREISVCHEQPDSSEAT